MTPIDREARRGNGRRAGPPDPPADTPATKRRVRIRKLRVLGILFFLGTLAFVSTVFGMMMAVTSDLPELKKPSTAQFELVDRNGRQLGLLTGNQQRFFINSNEIAPDDEAGDHRDRGPALLDQRGHRPPRHRPRAMAGRPRAGRRPGRLDDHDAARQVSRWRRRTSGRSSTSSARPRSPTRSRASGPRRRSSGPTSTRSTSATAPTASSRPPGPTSAPAHPGCGEAGQPRCAQVLRRTRPH